jgi:hypothetical protein
MIPLFIVVREDMKEPIIYLDILKQELSTKQLTEVLTEFFQCLQNCVEDIIEGFLNNDFVQIKSNLKTVQIIATSMYSPYVAEFALLCESYAEPGKESCLKETFVILFKQITLLKRECNDHF